MRYIYLILFVLFVPFVVNAYPHERRELSYEIDWCQEHGGKTEFILDDKSRVDCLTDEYAIEVEFSVKWKEAIGQALYYAAKTGKKPGIVLIIMPNDDRIVNKLELVAGKNGIRVWYVEE